MSSCASRVIWKLPTEPWSLLACSPLAPGDPCWSADCYLRVVANANQNLTKLFARAQLGRIVPPNRSRRWLPLHRALLFLVIVIIWIAINTLNHHSFVVADQHGVPSEVKPNSCALVRRF